MCPIKRSFSEDDVLYDTFKPIVELGRGGMGRILKVKLLRDSNGYKNFLSCSIAWHEVVTHPQVMPLRDELKSINTELMELESKELELMDEGDESGAEELRSQMEELKQKQQEQVDKIKERQDTYLKARVEQIIKEDTDALEEQAGAVSIYNASYRPGYIQAHNN